MKVAWAAKLPAELASALSPCRQLPAVDVAEAGDFIWLRGSDSALLDSPFVRALPRVERFVVDDVGCLSPVGHLLSAGVIPDLDWTPVSQWVRVALPPMGFAGRRFHAARLTLVPSSSERPANLLITRLSHWAAIALSQASARIDCWRFAVNAAGEAVVRGSPPPSVAGERYWEECGVAVPLGFEVSPPIAMKSVADLLAVTPGSVAVWRSTGMVDRIAAEHFVAATRAAIRMSLGAAVE